MVHAGVNRFRVTTWSGLDSGPRASADPLGARHSFGVVGDLRGHLAPSADALLIFVLFLALYP